MLLDRSTSSTFDPELGDVRLPSYTDYSDRSMPWVRITAYRVLEGDFFGSNDGYFYTVTVTKMPCVDPDDAEQHRFLVAAAPAGRVGRPDDLKVIQILEPSGPWSEQKLTGVTTESLNEWLFGTIKLSKRDRTRPLEELKEAIASRLTR